MFGKPQAIGLFLGFGVAFMASSLAAVDDCPGMKFWNGTHCVPCSPCPRGSGVKTKCSSKKDTVCEDCYLGFDYSNTSGFDRCFGCDEFSNCLPGNSKEIKNCTTTSPRECDGCEENNYFNPSAGVNGGCEECSPPCNAFQHETTPCTTDHDRTCSAKTTVPTTLAISSTLKEIIKSTFSTSFDTDGTVEPRNQAHEGSPSPDKTPTVENPWLWISIGVFLIAATVLIVIRHRRKRSEERRKKRGAAREMIPLIPGLERPIKDLKIDEKRFIAQRLNGKGNYGYYYWQPTGEKLGLAAECKAWEGAENPTDKLLKAYGEKEGSTIGNLIQALRDPEVGLTQFANEIEKKFSTTKDQCEAAECKEETV